MPATHCLIVGGGQAALSGAAKLRELDESVQITIVSAEDVLPYQRPPLSKAYLSGEMPLDRLLLRPAEWYRDQRIDIRLSSKVTAIDAAAKVARIEDGSTLSYDRLLLATGSFPRRLPPSLATGKGALFYLRDRIDSDAIRPHLKSGNHLVVIGGGYIGLEAAAIASKLAMNVTLVESADRILQRVAAPATSDYFRNLHRQNGVTIIENCGVASISTADGALTAVNLSSGESLDADLVLVGIGVLPNDELAAEAGLKTGNGIVVDERCATNDPDIFAAGDCTNFPWNGRRMRIESVPHAIHQAEVAAANMFGHSEPYTAAPWFWSDQYNVKLQIAGLNTGYDGTIIRPGKREGAQSVWYYRGEELLAVDAMNDAPSFMMARRILEAGKSVPKDIAGDTASNLKEWV